MKPAYTTDDINSSIVGDDDKLLHQEDNQQYSNISITTSDKCNKRCYQDDTRFRLTTSLQNVVDSTPLSLKRSKDLISHDIISTLTPSDIEMIIQNNELIPTRTIKEESSFEWCTCERDPEKIRNAFWLMELQEPISFEYTMQLNIQPSVNYLGCRNLFNVITAKIIKPRNQIEAFMERIRTMDHPLNFAVVGPNGSGRKRAVRFACSEANICSVTISKDSYESSFITMAVQYAYFKRPFLLLFDGFDELVSNPTFVNEFTTAILRNPLFNKGWNNVWIVATLSTLDSSVVQLLSRICYYDNIVCMEKPNERDYYDFLIKYIEDHNISVPDPTDAQSNRLLTAVRDSTPADVARFGDRIIASVMDNTTLAELAECSGHDMSVITLDNDQQQKPNNRTLIKCNSSSSSSKKQHKKSSHQYTVIVPTAYNSSSLGYRNNVKCPRVNWQRDIESKYINIGSSCIYNQSIIPRNINAQYIVKEDISITPW